jgi:hypothetical protein
VDRVHETPRAVADPWNTARMSAPGRDSHASSSSVIRTGLRVLSGEQVLFGLPLRGQEAKSRMENLSLATGHITPDARLSIELVDNDMPMVLIIWPQKPTSVSPKRYDEIASRAMRILANGSTELAARRRRS